MSQLAPDQVATFLGQTVLLKGVSAEVLGKLAPHLEQKTFPEGEIMLPSGTPVTAVGFMVSGRASVHAASMTNADMALEELLPGDVFGEVGLLLGGVNPMKVVAEEACVTLNMRKEHFEQVLNVVPGVAQALAKRLSARYVKVSMLGSARAGGGASRSTGSFSAIPSAPHPAVPEGVIPFVEISQFGSVSPKALDMLPSRVIQEHRLLPLELRGNKLVVGMVSPFSVMARQELRRILHHVDHEVVAVSADDFTLAVLRMRLEVRDRAAGSNPGMVKPRYAVEIHKEAEKEPLVISEEVVNLLDEVMLEALHRGASDVHLEPDAAGVRVRFRVHGMLHERKESIPTQLALPLVARIKALSGVDTVERRLPQDGRIAMQLGRREITLRVSTLQVARGEKVVIRLVDPGDVMRPLDQIYLDVLVRQKVEEAIAERNGLVIVAGPAGSGKSTSLYSMVNQRRLVRPDNHVVTVEDPVEMLFPGVTQVQLSPRVGLDFPAGLRALLRQDPDVIMIGELRDKATAGMAVEAALAGRLVFSSVHATTVAAVFERLVAPDLDPTLLAQALRLIVVQRLARRLCPACAHEEEASPALVLTLVAKGILPAGTATKVPRPGACDNCERTGYRGRVAVVEALGLNEPLRALLGQGAAVAEVLAEAERSGAFIPFLRSARLLMGRKMLAPADALLVVAG